MVQVTGTAGAWPGSSWELSDSKGPGEAVEWERSQGSRVKGDWRGGQSQASDLPGPG